MMREILSQRGFSQEEISTLESRDDYIEVRERVERMQADRLLDELETRTQARVETAEGNLDARWEAFKTDINAIEIPEIETPAAPETLEEIRTRVETEAQETLENSITQIMWNIPLIGWPIAGWLTTQAQELVLNTQEDTSFWGSIKRWFVTFIAGIFGVNSAIENFEEAINRARNITLPEVDAPLVTEATENTSNEIVDGIEDEIENLSVTNFRYNSWLNTLLFFSDWRNLENDSNVRNRIFDKIKNLPLNEVTNLRNSPERQVELFWEELDRPWFREWLEVLLPSFENAQFLEVCELSLGWDRIENILSPNGIENWRLFQILWEQRSREIIRLSNIDWFNLQSLSMFEISILYSASFPNLAYMRLASSLQLGVDIVDTASEEFQEMVENSASWRILAYLAANGDGTSLLRDDPWFLSSIQEADSEISVEEIQAVINFKNYILSADFQNNPSLRLSGDTLASFNNNLNYTRIILLYDILKWGRVENVNPLNFPILILAISSIIWWNAGNNIDNAWLAESYKWEFMRNGAVEFFGRNNLSQSERRAFEIYWSAFLTAGIRTYMEQVYKWTQFIEWLTWISDGMMFNWSAWLALTWRMIARQWMLRTSPWLLRIGWWLSRVWWWGMIIYGGILWYEYFSWDESENNQQTPDLPVRNNGEYIGHQIDLDLEEAQTPSEQMNVLSRLQENTYEYMIGNEPITVITYPWDIPHAVYQGKIWTFEALDWDNLAGDIEWHLVNAIRWIVEDEELNDDSVWTDWERIHVWPSAQNSYSFTINELFPPENNSTLWVNKIQDLSWAIRSFMDEEFPGHWYEWGHVSWEYIMIMQLPWNENKFLWLFAVPNSQQNIPVS